MTDSIARRRTVTALLNTASRTTLGAASLSVVLGVALPREARAGAGVVNPVQTTMYVLGAFNPITFGAGTQIKSSSVAGVYGDSSQTWSVANYGSIQGPTLGIDLASSGSTVTNGGSITGTAQVGVLLKNGGSVANQSSGSISGYIGVEIGGGGGVVTNAGSISTSDCAVSMASGSLNNELSGTLSMTTAGLSQVTASVGGGGSVTNAGLIINGGYNTAAVVLVAGGKVTNSGTIVGTGVLELGDLHAGWRNRNQLWKAPRLGQRRRRRHFNPRGQLHQHGIDQRHRERERGRLAGQRRRHGHQLIDNHRQGGFGHWCRIRIHRNGRQPERRDNHWCDRRR